MAKDALGDRFSKRLEKKKLGDLAKKTRTIEELDAEEELLANTPKVDPIKADAQPGRNEPCPCGSGKKYKKCCALKNDG